MDRLMTLDDLDYFSVVPKLVAEIDTLSTPEEKGQRVCELAIYMSFQEDSERLEFASRCIAAGRELGDKSLENLGIILEVRATYDVEMAVARQMLEGRQAELMLDSDLRARIMYIITTADRDYRALVELDTIFQELEIANSEERVMEKYLTLWWLANLETTLSKQIVHVHRFADFVRRHQLPLQRYVLIFNLAENAQRQAFFLAPGIGEQAILKYLQKAKDEDKPTEVGWAIMLLMLYSERWLTPEHVVSYASELRQLQLDNGPRFYAEANLLEAISLLRLGNYDAAEQPLTEAASYITSQGAQQEFAVTLRQAQAYLDIARGNIALGVETLQRDSIDRRQQHYLSVTDSQTDLRSKAAEVTLNRATAVAVGNSLRRANTSLLASALVVVAFGAWLLYLSRVLRASRLQAEAAKQAKSLFIADLSHEMRTPMNAILGYAEILQHSGSLEATERTQLGVISSAGEQLLQVVNDVLDISKVEAGRMELQEEEIELQPFFEECLFLSSGPLKDQGVDLSLEFCDSAPVGVEIDESKLSQIVTTILENAVVPIGHAPVVMRVSGEGMVGERLRLAIELCQVGSGGADEQPANDCLDCRAPVAGGERSLALALSRDYARLMGGDVCMQPRSDDDCICRVHVLIKPTRWRTHPVAESAQGIALPSTVALPATVREALRTALAKGATQDMTAIIETLNEENEAVARELLQLIEEYRYDEIERLIG